MDLAGRLDSTPFALCTGLKDDWFASYKSSAKRIWTDIVFFSKADLIKSIHPVNSDSTDY